MVNQVTGNNPFEAIAGSAAKADKVKRPDELGQDEFMTLMLAQMKTQDPLNPMENGEFIAQLAQFRTVTGVEQLNNSFDKFSLSMQSSQALQASTLVGREVLISGNQGSLPANGNLNGSIGLPSSSNSVTLEIHNPAGDLLGEVALGAHPAGQVAFSWDGKLSDGKTVPPGAYQLRAKAVIDGKTEAMDTFVAAKVESVSLKSGREPVLNLANVGPMDFSQVSEIR